MIGQVGELNNGNFDELYLLVASVTPNAERSAELAVELDLWRLLSLPVLGLELPVLGRLPVFGRTSCDSIGNAAGVSFRTDPESSESLFLRLLEFVVRNRCSGEFTGNPVSIFFSKFEVSKSVAK
jgi:hypothetical protein